MALGAKCVWGYWGSRSKLSRGTGSREDEEVSGEENGEGEVLEVPDWPGRWRRQELPEMRKEASPVECEAGERHWGDLRLPACSGKLGASFYRRGKAVPRRLRIRSPATAIL